MSSTDTLLGPPVHATHETLPDCILRDNLTSAWFPNTSRAALAAVVALCCVFLLTSFNRLNHTDLWGHLNYGRWIDAHGALPQTDPFSAAASSKVVLNSAWLAQLIGYQVQRTFGNEGLVFGHALLVTLTAGALMLAVIARGAPAAWAWAAAGAMFVLDLPILGTVRPQLFGQLGAALVLLACAQLAKRKHPLIWLPLVMIAWANLHGSILIGLLILTLYVAGLAWDAYLASGNDLAAIAREPRVRWAALLLAVSLAAGCVNPHGPSLLVQAVYFGENPILAQISEWRSLSPNSLTGLLMIVSAAGVVGLYKYSGRKWETFEILLLVAFALATLSAIRMLAWWALIWPFVAIPHAAVGWERLRRAKLDAMNDEDSPTAMRTVIALGFVFMTLLLAPPSFSMVTGRARGVGPILVTETPLYVADEAVCRGLAGNFAAPMDWADYLVWKSDGKLKPLVYSHVHLADAAAWDDYIAIFRGSEGWIELCRSRELRYLIVNKQVHRELLTRVLLADRAGNNGLRVLYQDKKSLLAEVLPAAP